MAIEIDRKIVGYEVLDDQKVADQQDRIEETSAKNRDAEPESSTAEIIQMHEKLERPEMLLGSTYKIKTPQSEHALYITINDIVLNQGTEHEMRRPYEIFINSKNMDHFQWIVALTRIISAVFRKGGDVTFLVDELRSVFDPRGGYFKKGGKYKPSL
ncbi:MAG: NrdJb, partial [Gammaproteobacteria bacterium]